MPATTDACIRALIHGVHSATEGRSRPNFLKFLTLRIIGPRLQDVTSNHATVAMRPRALRSYKSLYCKHLTHYSSGAPMRPGGPGIFSCLSPPLDGPASFNTLPPARFRLLSFCPCFVILCVDGWIEMDGIQLVEGSGGCGIEKDVLKSRK